MKTRTLCGVEMDKKMFKLFKRSINSAYKYKHRLDADGSKVPSLLDGWHYRCDEDGESVTAFGIFENVDYDDEVAMRDLDHSIRICTGTMVTYYICYANNPIGVSVIHHYGPNW